MNYYLDVFPDDRDCDGNAMARLQADQDRSGPNEDDYEYTTSLMEVLPEESEHEHGSPLSFGEKERLLEDPSFIDSVIEEMFIRGLGHAR